MTSSPTKTNVALNKLRALPDKLLLLFNRYSIKTILFIGFAFVIIMGLTAVLVTEWTVYVADREMDRLINVDNKISDFCLKSVTAMTNARRYEKDFLLSYNEFGFYEAKSRYITRVLTSLSDIRAFMRNIRLLTNEPEVVRDTQEVDQSIDQYQTHLLGLIEKYRDLGFLDTGLVGAMRGKAHDAEDLLTRQRNDLLFLDLLLMRRWEKDFIERNRDIDAAKVRKAADRFKNDLDAFGVPEDRKVKLRNLIGEYRRLFEQCVRTVEKIRAIKKGLLKTVQSVEPVLERLYTGSLSKADAAREHMKKTEKISDSIKAVIGPLFLIFSLALALIVAGSISKSVAIKAFARHIAAGDLTGRLQPEGRNEFAAMAVDLNILAEALQQAKTERKQSESRIYYLAYYDGLTGLPNRTFFKELLKKTLAYARRYNLIVAVLCLDIDDFKRINDTLGHEMGDILLQDVSKRLTGIVRQSDSVARSTEETTVVSRLGGDEFVVLLNQIGTIHDAGRVAGRILKEVSRPFVLGGQEVFITTSMGISVFPGSGENVDELLKNADAAMYHAKAKGKNNYQFYSEAMSAAALELLTLENKLHKALERNELLVYYQPKMDLAAKKITGMEALVRWQRPDSGLIPPSQFIPLAETSGLIMPIGKFVLHTACLQNRTWQEAGLETMSVAVNLSSRQFDQKGLVEEIKKTLNEIGLSPQYLELEITESVVMRNPEKAIETLRELKETGIRIAVDDFGTGYSSLNYLRRLPLDALKIDISFIRNVTTNPNDAVIVRTIIAMAHSLNLKTIAEGVENEQQMAFLQEYGCDAAQGFLLSPPLPPEEFLRFLTKSDYA